MKNLKIAVLILLLILGFFIPYSYSVISGNMAVSMVDATSPIKYYTMIGDTTNGLWVNVKTGTVVVTQSNQANLLATVYQPTASNLNATVVGTKTNNNAAPSTNNVGALVGIANATSPTYTEGNEVLLSTDLLGALRVVPSGNSGLMTIDIDHMMIHLGKHYRAVDQQTIASSGTYDYLLIAPNTTTRIHFGYHTETDCEMTIVMYETPTYGSTGSAIASFNNDRNSGNTAALTLYSGPSITTTGTLISRDVSGSGGVGGRTGNVIESGDEFILKQNTPYLLRISNIAAVSGIEVLDMGWYEFVYVP